MADALYDCFCKLIEIQEERVKHKGIRGMLSKLTGAFVPEVEKENENEQENVQEEEERNDEDERE